MRSIIGCVAITLIIFFVSTGKTVGQATAADGCGTGVRNTFPTTIVVDSAVFYVVDDHHLLETRFNAKCRLIEARVIPKSFVIETEPDENSFAYAYSQQAYSALKAKIASLRSLGSLVAIDQFRKATNGRTWVRESYDSALIDRAYYDEVKKEGSEEKTISLSVLFKNTVDGLVDDTGLFEESGNLPRARVRIGEHWYWTEKSTISTVVRGNSARVEVFGGAISSH